MTNKTNRIAKICKRIDDIEHALACKDQSESKTIELCEELSCLTEEYDSLLIEKDDE